MGYDNGEGDDEGRLSMRRPVDASERRVAFVVARGTLAVSDGTPFPTKLTP